MKKTFDDICTEYINLVKHIVFKFKNRGQMTQDMIQEGVIGLYHAYQRYDELYGNKFSTYAYKCIEGYVKIYYYEYVLNTFITPNRNDGEIAQKSYWEISSISSTTKSLSGTTSHVDRIYYSDINTEVENIIDRNYNGTSRDILKLKFLSEIELTQVEIAEKVGVSKMWVTTVIANEYNKVLIYIKKYLAA